MRGIPTLTIDVNALRDAARRPVVVDAMRTFYEESDRLVAAELPVCWNRGACCRFGEFGHRLYVTALEVVYYLAEAPPQKRGRSSFRGRSVGRLLSTKERAASPFSCPTADTAEARERPVPLPVIASHAEPSADVCPHAFAGLCHARSHRPLGCRIFYCDPGAQHWQGPLTEERLTRLRAMHEQLDVPYFYADWIAVLRALRGEKVSG